MRLHTRGGSWWILLTVGAPTNCLRRRRKIAHRDAFGSMSPDRETSPAMTRKNDAKVCIRILDSVFKSINTTSFATATSATRDRERLCE